MDCPTEIAAILLDLIRVGLLRIRNFSSGPDRCVIEADHLHNLPSLLRAFSPDLLLFYWEVERVAFIEQSPTADLAAFEPLWEQLGPLAEKASPARVALAV